jgi:hypothetical protein
MKLFLSKVNYFKNYFLRLSQSKKIFLLAIAFIILIFVYLRIKIPFSDINNALNSQTVISAVNIGDINNEIIFETADKKVEIENNASWFKNENGNIGSVVVIKDVGSMWKKKDFLLQIVGDGEIAIKLSGLYAKFSDSPTIFIAYQNLTIDGKEIPVGLNDGRNDKDGLMFRFPVKNGQKLEMSFEYKNGTNWLTILNQSLTSFISLLLIFLFYYFRRVFNRESRSRIICKIVIITFIIIWVYFILLGAFFGKQGDEFHQTLFTTAIGKDIFISLGSISRFWPFGLSHYNILRLLPYGFTPQAHYMLNSLFFVGLILLLFKIANFNLALKPCHFYIKTFLICCLPFTIMSNTWESLSPFFEVIFAETFLCFLLALFIFCYQKMTALNNIANEKDDCLGEPKGSTLAQEKALWAILAIIIAVYSTYCKEPVFVVFFIIACVNLLFAKKPLKRFDKIFNCTLIANAICFIVIFYFMAFSHKNEVYAFANTDFASFQFADILKWVGIFPTFLLCIIFVVIRLYFVLFKKEKQHLFYDGILFGSFGYCAVIIILRLPLWGYYLFPGFVLFFIVLVYWLINFYNFKKYITLALISTFIFIWSLDGFLTAIDVLIKNHSLAFRRQTPYNFLKVDMLSKYGNIIYIGRDERVMMVALQGGLQYFNSDLYNTEGGGVTKSFTIEEIMQNQIIHPKSIYITMNESSVNNNESSYPLILVAKLSIYGNQRYVFMSKERL